MRQGFLTLMAAAAIATSAMDVCHGAVLFAETPAQLVPEAAFANVSIAYTVTRGQPGVYRAAPDGTVSYRSMPLRELIAEAFAIPPTRARFIIAGSERLMEARYDISAVAPQGASRTAHRLMLRALLADRFGLRSHEETREVEVYVLRMAKAGALGPQLRRSQYNCESYMAETGNEGRNPAADRDAPRDAKGVPWCSAWFFLTPGAGLVVRGAGELRDLAGGVEGYLDRALLDRTGLEGNFEWVLTLARARNAGGKSDSAAAIRQALENQLGLTLDSEAAVLDIRVIDSLHAARQN